MHLRRLAVALLATWLGVLAAALPAGARAPQQRIAGEVTLERPLIEEINGLRAARGLTRLVHSAALARAARFHSVSMAQRGYFSHTSADGTAFDRRVQRFYPPTRRSWTIGENLLWATPSISPAEAVQAWLESPTHRRVLLTAAWREVGIGAVRANVAPGVFGGREVVIVTADFGAR